MCHPPRVPHYNEILVVINIGDYSALNKDIVISVLFMFVGNH